MSNVPTDRQQPLALSEHEQIDILLEEYRALYRLLVFRLTAMDRRLPVAGGLLALLLGTLTAMPPETRVVFLLVLPAALAWLMWTTASHARAKEDHLRRIDEIERHVNRLAGGELLVFQSQHPNKKRYVAGRTGTSTLFALATTCITLLVGCSYLFDMLQIASGIRLAYHAYTVSTAAAVISTWFHMRRYRYQRVGAEGMGADHYGG